MLHRSFKPAKCKTSLKLAMSRIKLLKNKRKAQVTQLKRELAQLLESGQDQTARIRVEHVVREEKTVAAYDLIEIYCELIAARLPIIESQKNCPIDLKEAITSVIFASPRCADIPELMDVRKHFTAKYGKEFISSAIELRPECGVNRMLVEKLSALAPDGPTKIKILSTIAEEHNIKWEPKSFGEKDSKPPDDLLNGPNNFEKASKLHVEPPNVQAQHNRDQNHDIPVNHHEHNARSSQSSQNFPSTDFGANKTTSATSHPEVRHPDTGAEGMDFRHSFSGDGNAFSSGRQNWNFEFKDATSAAQAAAESAERASMAARAAAELSSRGKIIRQYSTESQKSSVYGLSDEGPVKYAGSKLQGENFIKDSANYSFNDRNPRVQNEQVDGNEKDNLEGVAARFYRNDHGSNKRSSRSASLKSNVSSIDDETLVNSLQKADRYSQKSSSEVEAIKPEKGGFFGEVSMEKQSSKSRVEFVSGPQGGVKTENIDYFGEVRIGKQSSSVSSRSHSSTSGDDHDVILNSSRQKFENDAGEDPFLGIDRENIQRDTKQTNSYDNAAVAFDESGSDDDDGRFDVEGEYNGQESNLYFPSPYSESPTHLSENTNAWSPRKNTSESLGKSISQSHFSTEWRSPSEFSESVTKSAVSSQPDDFLPVSFDGSNDPSSEGEEVEDKYKLRGRRDPSILPRKQNVYFRNPEPTQSESHGITESSLMEKGNNRQPWLHSSSDNLDYVDIHSEKNQGTELNAESQKKFSFRDLPTSQPSPRPTTSRLDSDDIDHESFYNPVDEGKLQQSPQPSRLSLVHEVKDKDSFLNPPSPDSMTDTEFLKQSSLESGKELNFGILTGGLRNKGFGHPPYSRTPSSVASSSSKQAAGDTSITIDQSTASPRVDKSISSGARNQESYNQSTKVIKKSSSRSPVTYFDSDNDDPEELPLQTLSSNQEPYNQKAGTEINEKLSSRTPITYFDSDSGDSVEDLPKQTSNSGGRSGTGFSRRTKASPSNSEMSSYSKLAAMSEASVTSDYRAEKKPSSRSSRATEILAKPKPQTVSSGHWRSSEQPRSSKQAASKPMPESKVSSGEERLKSSAMGQPSNPLPKIVTSGSTESSKTSSSSGVTSSRENSIKKASHVHPKLPDYDTISAHLQSLRSNRQ